MLRYVIRYIEIGVNLEVALTECFERMETIGASSAEVLIPFSATCTENYKILR